MFIGLICLVFHSAWSLHAVGTDTRGVGGSNRVLATSLRTLKSLDLQRSTQRLALHFQHSTSTQRLAQRSTQRLAPYLGDIESGAILRTFEGHSDSVNAVALSEDGTRALSGSRDRTLKLWDTESGAMLRTLEGHSSWVLAVSLSEDGTRALSGSDDRTLKLWDTRTGRLVAAFSADTAIFSCDLSMTPAPVLAAGDQSGRVYLLRLCDPHAEPAIIRLGRIGMDAIRSLLVDDPRPPLDTDTAIDRVLADLRRIIDTLATERADNPHGPTAADTLSQASNRAILALDQRAALDRALLRRAADRLAGEPTTSPELAAILHAIKAVL